ncbi:MAG: autotransporter domain-containing protein [Rhizobacter sp.]
MKNCVSELPRRSKSRAHLRRSNIAAAIAVGITGLAFSTTTFAADDTLDQTARDHAIASAVTTAFRATSPELTEHAVAPMAFSRVWKRAPRNALPTARLSASNAARAMDTPAAPNSPDAWITEEFQADWGLEVINAHHAYARGLTGAGVRLGLLDSGAGLDHTEFAGKDHRAIVMAELRADGSFCSDTTVLAGPDACFYSEGDKVAIDAEYYDPSLQQYFPDPANDYLWGTTFYSYGSHGTHVAGTMAANRDGSGMHGVAFGADLSSARLFNDSLTIVDAPCYLLGECTTLGTGADSKAFAQMYEQAIDHGVQAMNHSWGYTYRAYSPDEVELYHDWLMANADIAATFEQMVGASRDSGMLQVVAAGNSTTNASPEASPHASAPATLPMLFPEIEQYWLSVVNLNDQLELSNRSMKCGVSAEWCIAAPGTDITSSVYGGEEDIVADWVFDSNGNIRFEYGDFSPEFGYADYSGTSMAAPHVTGALGLLFERFPYLTGAQVRDVMLTTATDLGDEGVDEIYGWGLLNLKAAIEGPGLLRVDTDVVMDAVAGGRKVWEGGAWDDWTNDIGGPGRLSKSGAGWLRLSGDNSFAGATVRSGILELDGDNRFSDETRVEGGALLLNGSLRGSELHVVDGLAVVNGNVTGALTRVDANGTLGGSGTLADTWVAGTIAPGNSIGTLTVDGDYVQVAGSVFEAELQPPSDSDLLRVTGTALIEGGTLRAISLPGTYLLGQNYQLITADAGLSGTFDALDISALSPFLSLSLIYGANGLDVDVARGAALASEARTANQLAVAQAADALAFNQGLPVALTQLTPEQARRALDGLSGEVHASAQAILIDSGRMVRNTALARAALGQDTFTSQQDFTAATGAWVEIQRQGGRIEGDASAARVQSNGSAALVGIDHVFAGWRLGVFGGTGRTDFDVRQRGSKGETDSRHVGIYASNSWAGFGVRAGYGYTWHELDIERRVAFPGVADVTRSRYDADAWQAFIEAGYRINAGEWSFEPYLQYAHVELDTDAAVEDGGFAALSLRAASGRVDLTTAGVRLDVALRGSQQDQSWLSLRGNLGYRYAGGDQTRSTQVSWTGGEAFSVRSPAITDDATLVELGLAARTSTNSLFEVGYSGVISDDVRDHGANARFSIQF